MAHGIAFARAILKDPVTTGALAPSSRSLARAVVAPIRFGPETFVVEVGCGTGSITEAVFSLGLRESQYLGIELNPLMIAALQSRFPSATFLQGSAEHVVSALSDRGRSGASYVVSSLPWTLLAPENRCAILRAIAQTLGPEGQLLSYSYLSGCFLPAWSDVTRSVRDAFSSVSLKQLVWRNLPPAFTWAASNSARFPKWSS